MASNKQNITRPSAEHNLRGKRIYAIRGTDITGESKEELKAKRAELNLAAGFAEVETKKDKEVIAASPSNTWPYRITKGPDHPHVKPLFGEVKIGTVVTLAGNLFRKTDQHHALRLADNHLTTFGEFVAVGLG